jgi:hypothetical protein
MPMVGEGVITYLMLYHVSGVCMEKHRSTLGYLMPCVMLFKAFLDSVWNVVIQLLALVECSCSRVCDG